MYNQIMKIIDKPKKYISIDLIPFSKKLEVIFLQVTNFLPIESHSTANLGAFLSKQIPPTGVYIMEQIGEREFKAEFDREKIDKTDVIEYLKLLGI